MQAAIPGQSQRPTIGWPRCDESATWCNQSGQLRAGTTVSIMNIRITSNATISAAYEALTEGELVRAATFADSAVNRSARIRLDVLAQEHGVDLNASATFHAVPDLDLDDDE